MNSAKLIITGLLTWLLFFSGTTISSKKWDFWKEREGIKVYTRVNTGSRIKELKMETVYRGTLSSFVAVLQDFDSYGRWVYANKEAKLVKYISDTQQIYYGVSDFPWPMSDRDYVIENKIWQDPETYIFHSLSVAKDGIIPSKKNLVRISELHSKWTLTPIRKGEFKVVYTVKSDPRGSVPAWVTNIALDVGPFNTLKALQDEMRKPAYSNMQFDFISEPDF